MGSIVNRWEADRALLPASKMPVILLDHSENILPEVCVHLDLNLRLAESLLPVPQQDRPLQIRDVIQSILYRETAPLLLEKYEMLFSPEYRLNVLKVFSDLARFRPLFAVWPGKFTNNTLIYAEPGDPEYRTYRITDHDVIVIS